MGWYSVRCIFELDEGAFEERITLWSAASFDEAIERAEQEAEEYASGLPLRYGGLAQVYQLADEPADGAEVFSLVRDSDLDRNQYIDAFFDTGHEHQQDTT